MGDIVAISLLGVLGLLLVSAGVEDARRREIADWKNIAIAALAPLWWWSAGYGWGDVGVQLAVAVAVFALFLLAFNFGQMGGGDVKLIGALALWVPLVPLVWMLIVMSLAGGAITLVLLLEARWRRNRAALEVPYGVAIAIAALLWIREPIINHFG